LPAHAAHRIDVRRIDVHRIDVHRIDVHRIVDENTTCDRHRRRPRDGRVAARRSLGRCGGRAGSVARPDGGGS
jgi:hypothetical protein